MKSRSAAWSVPFQPAWWLPGPHLPTLWGSLARRRPVVSLKREQLELDDGDFIDLCWAGGDTGPLVVILHGLEGSCESKNVRGLLARVHDRGWGGVLMQFRGCSGRPNRKNRSYHSGDTGDLRFLLNTISRRFPNRRIFAAGISLGGNVLLKYLGEQQSRTMVYAACAVSVPYDLAASATHLHRGFARLYEQHLVSSLQNKVLTKFQDRQPPFELDHVSRKRTFWDFDDYVTAPLHGFADAASYYRESSSGSYIHRIERPTLLIHAKNDPFLPASAIPKSEDLPGPVEMRLTKSGGHVGFVTGQLPFSGRYWIDDQLMAWFEHHI